VRTADPTGLAAEAVPAGQLRGLLDPTRHQLLVDLVILVDVEVARPLVLGLDRRKRLQRRASEEGYLDVLCDAMEAEEPAQALAAIEGRVPPHRLADAGHGSHDQRIEPLPHV